MKNGAQQIARDLRVQADSALDEGAQADFALDHDQCANFSLRQAAHCQHHFLAQFAALQLADSEERPPAQARQCSPEFSLKHHDQGDGGVGEKGG